MPVINRATELRNAIAALEVQKQTQEQELKIYAGKVLEELKPGNLIAHTLHQPSVQNKLINAGVALATGYLSKNLLVGAAAGPVKKVAGDILQWGVTAATGSKMAAMKEKIGSFLRKRKFKEE